MMWCRRGVTGTFKRFGFFGYSHERSRSTNVKHTVFFHPHFANGELERREQLAALIVYPLICADNIDVWKRGRCKKCKAVWTEPSNDCNQKHMNQSDIWCWLELSERSLTHRSQGKSTFLLRISAISTNLQMSGQTDPLWINRLWWQTCATGKAWFLFQKVVFVSKTYCSGLNPVTVNSNFTALKGSAHPHYKQTIILLSISAVSGNANHFHFICWGFRISLTAATQVQWKWIGLCLCFSKRKKKITFQSSTAMLL